MTGFSPDWLALRAAADRRARDNGLAARLGAHFAGRRALRVLDLGSGTGANLRATAPLIAAAQHWVLTDNDAVLLARAEPVERTTLDRRVADLESELEGLFDPSPDLITASAFFDLCGTEFIHRVVALTATSGAALYTVLSYDGREEWAPDHPLDRAALAAFHTDQRRDKGLGAALGPDAHGALAAALRAQGYQVFEASSDWQLAQPGDAALIGAMAEGSAAAIRESLGVEDADAWCAARKAAERVTIGHRDLLALPPD